MSESRARELVLEGCAPTPLASYLKALGVLRLLGEQRPEWGVRGAWRNDRFVLASSMFTGEHEADRQRLGAFFIDDYRPTPIVAPWNGGSGFFPGDNRKGIDELAGSLSSRFADYRDAIGYCRQVVKRLHLEESPKADAKAEFLNLVRSSAPESLLVWMDAAILLAGDEPRYPPLLGTGGNDGRLDFTNNFMQRLTDLINTVTGDATEAARAWISASLWNEATANMTGAAIGQFNPGGVGGPNASAGFEGDSLINPWDFVLMLEGALLFAAASTRKLESSEPGMLAYPFTVRPTAVGSGGLTTTDEGQARAEMWLPLWQNLSTPGEIKSLLSEGRATLGRKPVRDGFGFARAVAALGVDRGIGEFQRYGFLMRSGKAYLATPLPRVVVRRNPDADIIGDLEAARFLDNLRRFARTEEAPARIRSHVRQLENMLFEFTQRAGPNVVQGVIIHIAEIVFLLGKSRKGQEAVPSVPTLSEQWALKGDDGSPEFRIAVALAGLYGPGLSMRPFVAPLKRDKYGGWVWDAESRQAVWGKGELCANICQVIERRRLEAERTGSEGTPFQFRAAVASGDVAAWLFGQLDEPRLAGLLAGLVHVRIPGNLASQGEAAALPAAYAVLKPFFVPDDLLHDFGLLAQERALALPGELIAKLQANHAQEAVDFAWRRLRAAGYPLSAYPKSAPSAGGLDGRRLLAALAVPLALNELGRCLRLVTRKESVETV